MADFGLGAVKSPPDPRDYQIADLYAITGTERPVAFPVTFVVPGAIPVGLNQGSKPQCVAYSSELMKAYQDRIDQAKWFPFDEDKFFARIGGTSAGAYLRAAMDEMRSTGYPVDAVDQASQHKIAAYYSVPPKVDDIKAALMSFGPVVLGANWYYSWFNPTSTGLLRAPTSIAGGHAIAIIGWDARGLRLRNSWGVNWGINGDCWLPYEYATWPHIWEAWKSVDVIEPAPPAPDPVTFKYGGFATPGTWKVMFNSSRFRRSPYIQSGNIISTVNAGTLFTVAQTTNTGTLVSGSRKWLGDRTGDKWMHSSLLSFVK